MKVVSINTYSSGSTGTIMRQIGELAEKENIQYYSFSSAKLSNNRDYHNHTYIDTSIQYNFHKYLGNAFGLEDFGSLVPTLKLIRQIEKIDPDIVHLHNIHGYCFDVYTLLRFLVRKKYRVIWTLHDCWTFTGRCPYFLQTGCEKWLEQCFDCKYSGREYPQSRYLRLESNNFQKKKKIIPQLSGLTIVTPSEWLSEMVNKSFLSKTKTLVINNGIDTNTFTFRRDENTRSRYGLSENKFLVLAVAGAWTKRKGLDDIIIIARELDSRYFEVVVVGELPTIVNEFSDSKSKIKCIGKTNSPSELADIYSCCDCFINPTHDDNYPTTNLEALSCKLPVITYNTGGAGEMVDESVGRVIETGRTDLMVDTILKIRNNEICFSFDNLDRSKLDKQQSFRKYIDLYKQILNVK